MRSPNPDNEGASVVGARRTRTSATDLADVSIYLDETTDTYLETLRAAAQTARPP